MSLHIDIGVERGTARVEAAFEVEPGWTVGLLGPNGAGKSTIVDAVAGLLSPTTGSIVLDGAVLAEPRREIDLPPQQRYLGVLFQGRLLFPHLSVAENVAFPMRCSGWTKARADSAATEMLERFDAGALADARPRSLSGGEAQRVALARALVGNPSAVLLDEPLTAVDAEARVTLRGVLREVLVEVHGPRLVITHDPVDAMELCDRLVVLEDGRVTQQGTVAQISEAPASSYAAELVGLNLFRGTLSRGEGGAGVVATLHGEIVVGWPEGLAEGDEVLALLRPGDVVLHAARPSGSSRNVVSGEISALHVQQDRVRIRLASEPRLVAEVTPGSVERLGLRLGERVWASFKAVEVRVEPAPRRPDPVRSAS
jgi:molybdate transport system ATP-binding protein